MRASAWGASWACLAYIEAHAATTSLMLLLMLSKASLDMSTSAAITHPIAVSI